MWAAQYYHYRRPRQLITSGGAGTMGFGLGAAIGAKYGNPDFPVFNIAGDGCFRMNMNELATASRYNVPIIQVVINNKVLGMVRQWQTLFYGKRYSATVLDDKVDFWKVAEGLGCKAIRVSTKEEVAPAIKEALDTNGPVLIEVMIGKDDKVFPMVAPGGAISKAFDESDLKPWTDRLIKAGFDSVQAHLYHRVRTLDIQDYIGLLNTYSDHRALPEGDGKGAAVSWRTDPNLRHTGSVSCQKILTD